MSKDKLIEGILDLNMQLRVCEEVLANILTAIDSGVDLESVTDKAMLQKPPVTSVEGIDLLSQRLNCIEDMIRSLVVERSLSAASTLLQYQALIKGEDDVLNH